MIHSTALDAHPRASTSVQFSTYSSKGETSRDKVKCFDVGIQPPCIDFALDIILYWNSPSSKHPCRNARVTTGELRTPYCAWKPRSSMAECINLSNLLSACKHLLVPGPIKHHASSHALTEEHRPSSRHWSTTSSYYLELSCACLCTS